MDCSSSKARRRSLLATVAMKGGVVQWSSYVAYFFGGVFLVNSIPHLTSGVSGHRLATPFASPLGKGQSSPTVNGLYGSVNLAVGYLLVCQVGDFHVRRISDVLALGVGGLLWVSCCPNCLCIYNGRRAFVTGWSRLRPP